MRKLKRRTFITLLGGAAMWPLATRAQQAQQPRIAIFHPAIPTTQSTRWGKRIAGVFRRATPLGLR
jgi:hypothetical protein